MRRASLVVLILILVLAGTAWSLAEPAQPAQRPLPAAPAAWVTDEGSLFAPDARDRIAARLKALKDSSSSFLKIYVYTLKSADGLPVTDAMQGLYRRWRMRERESGDGLATIFLFGEERTARVMLGQGAPSRLDEAMPDIGRELSAVFPKGVEPPDAAAVVRVIDRIDTGLAGEATWLDAPPIPPDPCARRRTARRARSASRSCRAFGVPS